MTRYYLSEQNVEEAINYFKKSEFNATLALSYYLGFRHLGLSARNPVIVGPKEMTKEYKSNYADTWNKMFTLLGPLERSNKILGIVPFDMKNEVKKSDLYNPGTELKESGIVSRPKDSLKNLVRTVEFVDYKTDFVYAIRKTPEVIQKGCLSGNKISLKNFASWFFRFYGFEFEDTKIPSDIDFSRVVRKTVTNYFKLNKNDFNWLFDDDILNNSFKASEESITGEWLRNKFIFNADVQEIINTVELVAEDNSIIPATFELLESKEVKEYLKLTGDNPSEQTIIKTLLIKKQVVLTGVPGTGKSRFLDLIKKEFNKSEMVQFHANYSYEDFIGGETLVNGTIESRIGIFLAFCREAEKNPQDNYLFIIDELNRGNIAQIFGEIILTLDRGYSVKLARPIVDKENGSVIDSFRIPENVYIAGSMNTADRNIAFIDLAIRRRFAFIEINPNYEVVSALAKYRNFDLGNVLKIINNNIFNTLNKEELYLGQSYFLSGADNIDGNYVWSEENFQLQFNYVILPTLREYTFSDKNALITILGNELSSGIQKLEDFNQSFNDFFLN